MKRQNIRRLHPELDDAEVEERVLEWHSHRPGVEDGDADGASFILKRDCFRAPPMTHPDVTR